MEDLSHRLQDALSGRYTIERELGRGGMAVVYLASDVRHHRLVAVKVFRPELAAALGTDRFLREIEIAGRLQHPHVLPLHDSGEADGLLYYVMPYVEGESLRERLSRDGQLPLDEALRIAREVADALAYAHGLGLVHRDIKPENILLGAGHAVVADFGIARAISAAGTERLTATGVAIGTPAYMSPEQSTDDIHLDRRSDVYSLGCVLYEMLAGEPPFTGPSAQAIVARRLAERPRSLRVVRPAIPLAVEDAVAIALATVPADRYVGAAEFAKALELAAELTPVRGWRPRRSAIASVLALMAVLALATTLQRQFRASPPPGVDVVVVPFEYTQATELEARPQARAHDLFAAALRWIPGVRVIEGYPQQRLGQRWQASSVEDLLREARRLGGSYLVTGAVLPAAAGSRVTVELYAVGTGARIANGDEHAASDSLEGPVARLALRVAGALAERRELTLGPPSDLLSATSSAVAIGRLMDGQAAYWRLDFDAASAAFRAALAADSDCLLAYHRLSVAEVWRHDNAAALDAVETGLRRAPGRAPRWAELLRAQRYYLMGQGDSAIWAFQEAVLDTPWEIDAWLGLGEALFHFGGLAGHRPLDAQPALERVITMDSSFAPIYDHLVDVALLERDAARARRYLARILPDDPVRPAREAVVALQFGSRADRSEALRKLESADRYTISRTFALLVLDSLDLAIADSVASLLAAPSRTPDDRRRGADYRLVALAATGRWPDAIAAWEGVAPTPRFSAWLVQAYLAGYPASDLAEPMFRWARATLADGRGIDFRDPVPDERHQAVQALVHRASLEGDSAEVRRLLARLSAAGPRGPRDQDLLLPALESALRARLALLARDSAAAIQELERAVSRSTEALVAFFPLSTMAPQRLLLAELLAARGDRAGSRQWLDSFVHTWSIGDVLYASRVRRLRSRPGS